MKIMVKNTLLTLLKGMAMGAADVVPGVSGGTIAFITGIYQRLLNALKTLTPSALKLWWQKGFKAFWQHIDGTFLLALFAGIVLSVTTLAHLVNAALHAYPLLVWGFFAGLIVASAVHIGRQLHGRNLWVLAALIVGLAAALWVAGVRPVQTPVNALTVFGAGAIAICAMILPGISGSFLLLIMGMYPVIIAALTGFNVTILGLFVAGCIAGLLIFSHVLSWLLKRYYQPTLALLTGFLLGSLAIVWPWKQVLKVAHYHSGESVPLVQHNVWPWHYSALTGADPRLWGVLLLASLGVLMVVAIERVAKRKPSGNL